MQHSPPLVLLLYAQDKSLGSWRISLIWPQFGLGISVGRICYFIQQYFEIYFFCFIDWCKCLNCSRGMQPVVCISLDTIQFHFQTDVCRFHRFCCSLLRGVYVWCGSVLFVPGWFLGWQWLVNAPIVFSFFVWLAVSSLSSVIRFKVHSQTV